MILIEQLLDVKFLQLLDVISQRFLKGYFPLVKLAPELIYLLDSSLVLLHLGDFCLQSVLALRYILYSAFLKLPDGFLTGFLVNMSDNILREIENVLQAAR